jgi:hypothetical protein
LYVGGNSGRRRAKEEDDGDFLHNIALARAGHGK